LKFPRFTCPTQEALQEALESKEEKRVTAKSKKYVKKMKELRMAVRSSLYSKACVDLIIRNYIKSRVVYVLYFKVE
jgi:hypothetical protein